MKILFVNDEWWYSEPLLDIMTINSHCIKIADHPEEALRLLIADEFDVLVIDYKMPIYNGVQLLAKIREMGISTPAVLYSAGLPNTVKRKDLNGFIDIIDGFNSLFDTIARIEEAGRSEH